jgi:hypothetical protein
MKWLGGVLLGAVCAGCQVALEGPWDVPAESWTPLATANPTPWTEGVTPTNVHREHPRPQLRRKRWRSLNGLWWFLPDIDFDGLRAAGTDGVDLSTTVLVPFVPGAPLSGRAETPNEMVYLRWVELGEDWVGRRVLVHFEGLDSSARVCLWDGEAVEVRGPGPHAVELIESLGAPSVFALAVEVTGRGLWGSVWLESVPRTYIRAVEATPDSAAGSVALALELEGPTDGLHARAWLAGGTTGEGLTRLTLPVSAPREWTAEDPHLYELTIELARGDELVDRVTSYFAFRDLAAPVRAGLFDRGEWPGGGLTAPTDEARMGDVRMARALGFDVLARPAGRTPRRWLYHCDGAGMRVWNGTADEWRAVGELELEVDGETRSITHVADGANSTGGLMSYDRAALKADAQAVIDANAARD